MTRLATRFPFRKLTRRGRNLSLSLLPRAFVTSPSCAVPCRDCTGPSIPIQSTTWHAIGKIFGYVRFNNIYQ